MELRTNISYNKISRSYSGIKNILTFTRVQVRGVIIMSSVICRDLESVRIIVFETHNGVPKFKDKTEE